MQHNTQNNTGFYPSVSSVQFPPIQNVVPQHAIPEGMVPQVVGYMTRGANPQFFPANYFTTSHSSIHSPHSSCSTTPLSTPSDVKQPPSPISSTTAVKKSLASTPTTPTKPHELKDKHPCKYWDKCTKINYRDHTEHGEKYYHPCKLGGKCKSIEDPVHRSRFVHPCKYGSSCTKVGKEEHTLNYTHPCSSGTSCQKYLSGDIAHSYRFTHDSGTNNITTSTFVFNWPKEWENPPKLSNNPLVKPHFRMVTLSTSSKEYQRASKLFMNTASSNKSIAKIERIENYLRWNWYSLQKQNMKNNHNEQLLFHGTKQQYADKIAKEGFDVRISNNGKFGNGIYFSPDASYSLGYAGPQGRMFIVRVLVGSSHNASQGLMGGIKLAPQGFDSVSGCGGMEIIVYDNKQAYPEYMITYQ